MILVQSMPPKSSQVLADTPTNLRSAIHLTSSVSTKVQSTGGISSKGFQDTPSNLRSVGHLTSSVVNKVQSMPPRSSQVLADTPTNLRTAIHLTSSVSTKVQASRGRSSQSFQVNTTNCHAIGQLPSQNLTTETRNPTNRVRSNVTIHPARNLEEEFSATLHDTSKVMEENGVVENIQDVDNVPSVSPQINTNVQTSSVVDINHTIVIPPAPDGELKSRTGGEVGGEEDGEVVVVGGLESSGGEAAEKRTVEDGDRDFSSEEKRPPRLRSLLLLGVLDLH
nr:hypothetical protein Iba_chr13fCG5590 [Ipomoea batatas]